MSESKRELLKSAILAIMSASLLGTAVYYFIPQSPRFTTVAFALGEGAQVSGNYSTLFVHALGLKVTFLDGSVIPVYPIWTLNEKGEIIFPDGYSGEINATDLEKITIFVAEGIRMRDNGSISFIVGCVQNRTINVDLHVDEKIVDMGSSKTVGDIWRVGSGSEEGLRDEVSKFPLGVTVNESISTGYWKMTDYIWEISTDQLEGMLRSSDLANVTFTLDTGMYLKYKVMTSEGDISGDANLQWSGTWGTLQLLHEENKILLLRYNFSSIKLNMIVA